MRLVDPDRTHTYTASMVERTSQILTTADFVDMMTDLDGVTEEARDEEYTLPSNLAISNAKLLLERLYQLAQRRYEVYPTPDAEVAIDAPGDGCSVVLLCDSSGGVLCMANLPDGNCRKAYSTADSLPDSFIRKSLGRVGAS